MASVIFFFFFYVEIFLRHSTRSIPFPSSSNNDIIKIHAHVLRPLNPTISPNYRISLYLALIIGVQIKMNATGISNRSPPPPPPPSPRLIVADFNGDLNGRDFLRQLSNASNLSRPISTVCLSIARNTNVKVIVVGHRSRYDLLCARASHVCVCACVCVQGVARLSLDRSRERNEISNFEGNEI